MILSKKTVKEYFKYFEVCVNWLVKILNRTTKNGFKNGKIWNFFIISEEKITHFGGKQFHHE